MPYISGVLTGIALAVLVAFLIDHVGSDTGSQTIVNWGVLTEKLGAVKEEVRKDVHEATAPDMKTVSGETH
jgi:small basic protein